MAEIKSSLELAMERVKKIAISGEEREEIKQKEILQKAMGFFHRYIEGSLPLKEVEKEIERLEEKARNEVREILLSRWMEALSLKRENESLLRGIEFLKGQTVHPLREKVLNLCSQYREEKQKMKAEVRDRLVESLRKEGIFGSAVEPNIEGNPAWKKEIEKLDHQYEIRLDKIKEEFSFLKHS